MLSRMFERRCRGYEALGYEIVAGKRHSGLPVDVPLPSDPLWKRDYAASVRRLVRDGLEAPLAGLFVCGRSALPSDAEGVSRARSASEAFLYRRLGTSRALETVSAQATLSIPFGGQGRMEVDLCVWIRVSRSRSMAPCIWAMPRCTGGIEHKRPSAAGERVHRVAVSS